MLPGSNRGLGTAIHFPDVCKMAAGPAIIPIPLPDIAMNAQAVPFSPNIFVGFVPATNMASCKVLTTGDEAGALGGVITGLIKMQGNTLVGSPVVFWNNLPAEHLLVPTAGNNFNAMLGAQLVPSLTTTFVCFAGDDDTSGVDEERMRDLATLHRERRDDNVQVHLRDDTLVIRIALFDCDVVRAVFNVLSEHDGPVELDLRGNRGGDVDIALRLADDFLADGLVMARALDADGDEEVFHAFGDAAFDHPLTVRIDGATASAAELFAAAVADNGRARVVGDSSYGKATAQRVVAMPDGGPRYTTERQYLRPNGDSWHGVGIEVSDSISTRTGS